MRNHLLLISLLAALGATALPAGAAPYWYTYEGNALPEDEGWERHWGNDDGAQEGNGAVRTLEDGILTMDSMYSLRVYDYNCHYLHGALDPEPGELFIAEWRVYVEDWEGDYGAYDSHAGICTDDGWLLGIGLYPDHVSSIFEEGVEIPIEPGMFHEYRILSWDMRNYDLYIDGESVRTGTFSEGGPSSKFGWGDSVRGAASLAHWDYVRFGVVPEPCAIALMICLCACARSRRS